MYQLVGFLLVLSISSLSVCKIDPCSRVKCPHGRKCVLHPIPCYSHSCGYKAMCVPVHHMPTRHTYMNHHPGPVKKKGECPYYTGSVLPFCNAYCSTDLDCPGSRKCCGVCPRFCSQPIVPVHRKSGKCPKPKPGRIKCVASCRTDMECPGKQKCCGGCPRKCMMPVH